MDLNNVKDIYFFILTALVSGILFGWLVLILIKAARYINDFFLEKTYGELKSENDILKSKLNTMITVNLTYEDTIFQQKLLNVKSYDLLSKTVITSNANRAKVEELTDELKRIRLGLNSKYTPNVTRGADGRFKSLKKQ